MHFVQALLTDMISFVSILLEIILLISLCRDNGLIIEVDGGYHSEPRQTEDDEQRTEWLESRGYHVLRFTNDEVLYDLENVLYEIEQNLK